MTAHKHAALMLQYAQDAAETDKPWERWEWKGGGGWYPLVNEFTFSIHYEYRRKPKTLTYTVTVPEPLREEPEAGTDFFLAVPNSERLHYTFRWDGAEVTRLWLKSGLCFATKEDAITAAKAMLPVKGGVQ